MLLWQSYPSLDFMQSSEKLWLIFVVLQNNVSCGVYPAPLQSLYATVGALAAVHFSRKVAVPYDIVERLVRLLPG